MHKWIQKHQYHNSHLISEDCRHGSEYPERGFFHVWVGRAGELEEKLEKLRPHVVSLVVDEAARQLGHEVGELLAHRPARLLLQHDEEVRLEGGLLLCAQLREELGELGGDDPADHDGGQAATLLRDVRRLRREGGEEELHLRLARQALVALLKLGGVSLSVNVQYSVLQRDVKVAGLSA